jgi:hypothetical protein
MIIASPRRGTKPGLQVHFEILFLKQETVMIDPKKHSEDRGIIESILRFIPGFRGYLEKGYRQESDHLIRKWMADRLQQSKKGLDDYMIAVVNAGRLDQLTTLERVKNRLDALMLKMRGAVRGYSGFFDYVQVDVDLLDKVYEHDMSLVSAVDGVVGSIEQLAAKPDMTEAAAGELLRQIDDIDRSFAQRGEMLNGLGQ